MATKSLTTNYLTKLSNANHDGVSQQICDRLVAFTTNNQMLITARQGVVTARQGEDAAFKRFSGKDFASDDLKKEDSMGDNYMSTVRGILNGLLYLPETEPTRRKAQQAVQVFKDFDFSINDGFEAEARKSLNMNQQWQAATEYTLAELGIAEWVGKAVTQANKVLQLIQQRVDHESSKVKGELADARKATDAAIRQAYDIINALAVLQPSTELTQLITVLLGIEDRAKLYYISGGTTSGGDKPKPQPTPDGGDDDGPSSGEGDTSGDDDGPSGGSGDTSGDDDGPSSGDGDSSGGTTPPPGGGGVVDQN